MLSCELCTSHLGCCLDCHNAISQPALVSSASLHLSFIQTIVDPIASVVSMVTDSGLFSGRSWHSCKCTNLPGRLHAEDIQSAQHLNDDSMDGLGASMLLSPCMLSSLHMCLDASHTRTDASCTWLDISQAYSWTPHAHVWTPRTHA